MSEGELLAELESRYTERVKILESQLSWLHSHNFKIECMALEYRWNAYQEVVKDIRDMRDNINFANKYPIKEVEDKWL